MTAVLADRLGIRFLFDYHGKAVTPTLARMRRRGSENWGLHDVSFSVSSGEGVALIGRSGSGKTTLLRLMAGVFEPDAGSLAIQGRVASLLSIDAGLLSALTGRENAFLLGVLAGLSRRESRAAIPRVKERSGLGDHFEHPTLSFSQGMRARLAYAVAELVEPSILLLDEVHEALDHEFRAVLEQKAHGILDDGGIVIAAGHDHPMLARLAGRAIWMEGGMIREDGLFDDVRVRYIDAVESQSA